MNQQFHTKWLLETQAKPPEDFLDALKYNLAQIESGPELTAALSLAVDIPTLADLKPTQSERMKAYWANKKAK